MNENPSTFISYAWENDELKNWVKGLAIRLRGRGIDARLDQWELILGDQIPQFMESSVRDNSYVLIICTPTYKTKSEKRIGGVGYEGDIMTAEVLQKSNHRKFIPILKIGNIETSLPSWLKGKYSVDFTTDEHLKNNFEDLVTTILNVREDAPPLGKIAIKKNQDNSSGFVKPDVDENIKINGILIDEITQPLNNGARGSALYNIPFELNRTPEYDWIELFIDAWNMPPRFTQMHRPGIASVSGNKIILNGTQIEEVERYHKDTLKLAIEVANKHLNEIKIKRKLEAEHERNQLEEHKRKVDAIGKRIKFDD
jgi:hypothetical protein